MPSNSKFADYEPLGAPPRARRERDPLTTRDEYDYGDGRGFGDDVDDHSFGGDANARALSESDDAAFSRARSDGDEASDQRGDVSHLTDESAGGSRKDRAAVSASSVLRPGHGVAYAGLFLFTFVVYFRPYELIPALAPVSSSLAFVVAVATLLVYFPAQLGLEGNLTAPLREVKLAAALCALALLSLPTALNRGEAWDYWVDYLKVVLMFVVMVNVIRTDARLRRLVLLLLAASIILSFGAVADYRAGRFNMNGERITGVVGGMFGNPNDLALHLATMIPLAFTMSLTASLPKRIAYVSTALLMAAAIVFTFSRGGFLGLAAGALVLAWKLGRRHRFTVIVGSVFAVAAFVLFMPSQYSGRLTTIVDLARDVTGSAGAREQLLIVSLANIARHPLFGVGMGNFHIVSVHEQVSHNAYTQVGAELGVPAMIVYILFLLSPWKRLRRVERETLPLKRSRDYYWAVGLQASLAAYMVSSFFGSVAYLWYIYYLVAFSVAFTRVYDSRKATQAAATGEANDEPRRSVAADAGDNDYPRDEFSRGGAHAPELFAPSASPDLS